MNRYSKKKKTQEEVKKARLSDTISRILIFRIRDRKHSTRVFKYSFRSCNSFLLQLHVRSRK